MGTIPTSRIIAAFLLVLWEVGERKKWWPELIDGDYILLGVAFVIFATNFALLKGWISIGKRLTIHSAIWMGDDPLRGINYTKLINDQIRDGAIRNYYVHQDALMNPFQGESKRLVVRYSLGRMKNREVIVKNGGYLTIPEP